MKIVAKHKPVIKPKYNLRDSEQTAKENPLTFIIPTKEKRDNVKVGQYAKVCFEFGGTRRAERMWVEVTSSANGKYTGFLDNEPAFNEDLISYRDKVEFESKHIMGILDSKLRPID